MPTPYASEVTPISILAPPLLSSTSSTAGVQDSLAEVTADKSGRRAEVVNAVIGAVRSHSLSAVRSTVHQRILVPAQDSLADMSELEESNARLNSLASSDEPLPHQVNEAKEQHFGLDKQTNSKETLYTIVAKAEDTTVSSPSDLFKQKDFNTSSIAPIKAATSEKDIKDDSDEGKDEMDSATTLRRDDKGSVIVAASELAHVTFYAHRIAEIVDFLRLFFTLQIILDPSSRIKQTWDYIIILLVLYNAFVIPYYVAFDVTLATILLPLDIICTISMGLDILVTFRTGFLDFSGNMNYDSRAISKRYWKRGLILDLIGTFPMDIFTSLLTVYGQRYANLLTTNGLLRASRLAYNDRLAAFNTPTARIFKLLFLFFYMAHLFAAIFFFVGMVEKSTETWITKNNLLHSTITEQYIASLYWSLTTMVTVGYGDITPVTVYEQAVVIPILMFSALIYATVFSNMAYAIETITSTVRRYQNRMDMVKEFIKVYELPPELQRKLFDYTNAMWNQNKGFETDVMLSHLPTSVKAEVMLHINESLIQRVPLLKQCSDRFLEAIILKMSSQVCLAGDFVFRQGDKSCEMYFVRTGSVQIIMEDEENGKEEIIAEIHSFSDCPFFGEISLLLGETRTASAKATSKCILASLSQQDFFEVLALFPDEATSLRETASERIQADVDREKAQLARRTRESMKDNSLKSDTCMRRGGILFPLKKSKHETRLNALEMTAQNAQDAQVSESDTIISFRNSILGSTLNPPVQPISVEKQRANGVTTPCLVQQSSQHQKEQITPSMETTNKTTLFRKESRLENVIDMKSQRQQSEQLNETGPAIVPSELLLQAEERLDHVHQFNLNKAATDSAAGRNRQHIGNSQQEINLVEKRCQHLEHSLSIAVQHLECITNALVALNEAHACDSAAFQLQVSQALAINNARQSVAHAHSDMLKRVSVVHRSRANSQ